MLQAITLLLICQLAGEVGARFFDLDVPGPVLGMLLLFLMLLVTRRVSNNVASTAQSLLSHLSLLFVPAGVGVMSYWNRVGDEWVAIIGALIGSTLVALLVTGGVLRLWLQRGRAHE